MPVPVITSVVPSDGPTVGGNVVVVNGSNFTGTVSVTVGATPATSFAVTSDAVLHVTVPAGAAGTVDIVATNGSGSSTVTSDDEYTYSLKPFVYSVSPVAGPLGGTNVVTVTGVNFTGTTQVNVGSNSAGFTVISDTELTFVAPANAPKVVDVVVTNDSGQSDATTADQYTYLALPVVSGVNPSIGSVDGGSTTVVSGANFVQVQQVYFGGTPATSVSVTSSTMMLVGVPAVGAPGAVDVTVVTLGGTSQTGPVDLFTYGSALATQVLGILGKDYDKGTNQSLEPFITAAQSIVAQAVNFGSSNGVTLTTADQALLTLWLAAHLYCQSDKPLIQSTVTGSNKAVYSPPSTTGLSLDNTRYGQMAKVIDYTGYLIWVSRPTRATVKVFGSRGSRERCGGRAVPWWQWGGLHGD